MNPSVMHHVDRNLCLKTIRKLIYTISKIITKSKNYMCITPTYKGKRKYKNRIFTLHILKLNYFTRSVILGLTYSSRMSSPIAQVLYTRRKSVSQIYVHSWEYW